MSQICHCFTLSYIIRCQYAQQALFYPRVREITFFFCLFAISRAAPTAHGGFQARGQIGAVDASLRQSHSNVGSEPRLQPTPQLMATPDP